MVPIFSAWRWAKATRSGRRAIDAVLVHDLADHPRGVEAGEPGDVDGGLGVAGADQHAAVAGAQAGRRGRAWRCPAAPERGSMATATVRARSCAEMPVVTPSRASIETVKAVSWRRRVRLRHQRQAEGVEPLAGQREADQAAAVGRHEVDRGRRAHLRRDDEVALVLAVLVVDEDEHPAVARVLDDLLDRGDRVGVVVRAGARSCVPSDRVAARDTAGPAGRPEPDCAGGGGGG